MDDIRKMQEDAVRRVREMQSRARVHLEGTPVKEPKQKPAEPKQNKTEKAEETLQENKSGDFLSALFEDKDRTLIMALLVLLSAEPGNSELIFALLFILM